MPYKTIWEPGGIHWKYFGHVTGEEVDQANQDFEMDARSEKAQYQIVNMLDVKDMEWDPMEMVDISADDLKSSRSNPELKMAVVTVHPKIREYALSYIELAWKLNMSWEIRIFETLEAARGWLQNNKIRQASK